MFRTIVKLYDNKDNYIYYGGTIIYCDENEVCSVYNNILDTTSSFSPSSSTSSTSSTAVTGDSVSA